jgi:short-subunit dehydrogenase
MAEKSLRNRLLLLGATGAAAYAVSKAIRRSPDFRDEVVVITGGSRGLGLALAEEFRRAGAHLVLIARSNHELELAKRHLLTEVPDGGEIHLQACDVSDRTDVEGALRGVVRRVGKIDALVNDAGIIQVGPVESQTHKDFEDAMNVNFWGVVNTTLAVLPEMMRRGNGRIVNVTSIGGKIAMPHLLPYTCSKFAAVGFSYGLRAEVADKGVKVTTVIPGLMRTGSYMNADFKGDQESEYSWFSLSSSVPGLTISARKAARTIVEATEAGAAEVVLGVHYKIAAEFSGAFPGLTADILALVNRVLPASSNKEKKLGRESKTPISESFATKLGRQAAERYNQHAKVEGTEHAA